MARADYRYHEPMLRRELLVFIRRGEGGWSFGSLAFRGAAIAAKMRGRASSCEEYN